MQKRFLFIPFLMFASLVSCGQSGREKKLEKSLDQLIAEKYNSIAPGCAVLVARKGDIIYKKGFGSANLELDVPVNPEMIFRIGSITKQFTSICILQLVDKGQLDLQDTLQKFIKEFSGKGHAITIENLLTHTSGITDYELVDAHIPNAIRIEFPPRQIIDSLSKLPLEFTPGSKYSYSNSNYFLLGYILEQVTGQSYRDYLQQNIFNPAGLQNTYYDSPTQLLPGRVTGYTRDAAGFRNVDYISMSLVFSAGALVSNVGDLFKWQQSLNSGKLVKSETLEKAWTPFRFTNGNHSEYGYGWFIKEIRGIKSIGHGGAIDGFRSMETYFPDQDLFIATLFNAENDSSFNLIEDIAALATGNSIETSHKDLKINDALLNTYIGTYRSIEDSAELLKVYRKNDRLYSDLSNGSGTQMVMLAQSNTLFYLPDVKRIPTTVEFTTDKGIVAGLNWTQEKRHFFTKLIPASFDDTSLNRFPGIYRLTTDRKRTITIAREGGSLFAIITGQPRLRILFQTDTKFTLEGVTDASCEFIIEKGIVTRIQVSQNGQYVWEKTNPAKN